jgi:hypothetical protein
MLNSLSKIPLAPASGARDQHGVSVRYRWNCKGGLSPREPHRGPRRFVLKNESVAIQTEVKTSQIVGPGSMILHNRIRHRVLMSDAPVVYHIVELEEMD